MSNQGKWVINLSEDGLWDNTEEFDTKEEAISYGKENFEDVFDIDEETSFYVGQIERFVPSILVDRVLDDVVDNAYDEVGEVAEGFLSHISKEEYNFLEERLNEAFSDWLDETKNHPTFWKIINVEEVKF